MAEEDLRIVEAGEMGMRRLSPAEEHLVRESRARRKRRARQRKALLWIGAAAALAIAALATVATVLWLRAADERRNAEDRARVAIATSLLEEDPTNANLLLLEVDEPEASHYFLKALYEALNQPLKSSLVEALPTEAPTVFNHDSSRLVTVRSFENRFHLSLWSTAPTERLFTLGEPTENSPSVLFRPGGSEVAIFSEGEPLRIYDAGSGKLKRTLWLASRELDRAWFSPRGDRLLLFSKDGLAQVLDADSGERFSSFENASDTMKAYMADQVERLHAFLSLQFDGQRVAAVVRGVVRLWNATTGEELDSVHFPSATPLAVILRPEGARLLIAGKEPPFAAWLWDFHTRQVYKKLGDLVHRATFARFSPDGSRLAIVCEDGSTYVYYNTTLSHELPTKEVTRLVFNSTGDLVVTFSKDKTEIWDVNSGRLVMRIPEIETIPSPDASKVATKDVLGTKTHGNYSLQIWHQPTGAELATETELPCDWCEGALEGAPTTEDGAVISPNGTRIALEKESEVEIRAAGGSLLALLPGRSPVFSPDSERLLTVGDDALVRIWDAIKGRELLALRGHENKVHTARFSLDGAWVVTASADGTARLWSARNGSQVAVLEHGEIGVVKAAFHPDGTRLVTRDAWHRDRLWAFDIELLKARIRSGTNHCLDPSWRLRTLGEDRDQAWNRYERCETCLGRCPLPETRELGLEEAPAEALRVYRACQDRLQRRPPPDRSTMVPEEAWRSWQACVR